MPLNCDVLHCNLLYRLLCLKFCNGSSRLEFRFLLVCSETCWSKTPGFLTYGDLLGDATSSSLPYITVFACSMGFQEGGGICVSERCGCCYIRDTWFVSRPVLGLF